MIWFNNLIALLLPFVPKALVGLVAKTYIAGETLEAAVEKTRELNQDQIQVTLDLLGEDPETKEECSLAVGVYQDILQAIDTKGLGAGISLKPSHMGLKLDPGFCFENIRTLAQKAAEKDIFLRIDMEEDALRPATLDLFYSLEKEFSNVGIVVQAYLRCGIEDANAMVDIKANIRLCKGAYYWEDIKTVYKDPAIVNNSYAYLLEKYLKAGCFVGIATHDDALVFQSLRLIDQLDIPKDRYEFQMLYGVTEELRSILVDSGHPVRVYVPFGKEWFAYSARRLKENPKMVGYIISNAGSIIREMIKKT
jgi:proline dehydrogenase